MENPSLNQFNQAPSPVFTPGPQSPPKQKRVLRIFPNWWYAASVGIILVGVIAGITAFLLSADMIYFFVGGISFLVDTIFLLVAHKKFKLGERNRHSIFWWLTLSLCVLLSAVFFLYFIFITPYPQVIYNTVVCDLKGGHMYKLSGFGAAWVCGGERTPDAEISCTSSEGCEGYCYYLGDMIFPELTGRCTPFKEVIWGDKNERPGLIEELPYYGKTWEDILKYNIPEPVDISDKKYSDEKIIETYSSTEYLAAVYEFLEIYNDIKEGRLKILGVTTSINSNGLSIEILSRGNDPTAALRDVSIALSRDSVSSKIIIYCESLCGTVKQIISEFPNIQLSEGDIEPHTMSQLAEWPLVNFSKEELKTLLEKLAS